MSWTQVDELKQYIEMLIAVGINVPREVRRAIEILNEKQLKDHGK